MYCVKKRRICVQHKAAGVSVVRVSDEALTGSGVK